MTTKKDDGPAAIVLKQPLLSVEGSDTHFSTNLCCSKGDLTQNLIQHQRRKFIDLRHRLDWFTGEPGRTDIQE